MQRVVLMVVVLACALMGLLAWKIRAQQLELEGPPGGSAVIEGEGADLSARLSARVAALPVAEGQPVRLGTVVVKLECDENRARLAEAQARLASAEAQAQAAAAQVAVAERGSSAARASASAAQAQLEALRAQLSAAHRQVARYSIMGEHAAEVRRDEAQTQADGLDFQQQAARASHRASSRQARAKAAQVSAARAQVRSAEQSVAALRAVVHTAQIAVQECDVRAPRNGVVERLDYEIGELVRAGARVARIVDPQAVRATFYLPNRELGAARVGEDAVAVADAYPGRTFVASVHRVGLSAEFTPRNIQTRTDRDRLVYPVEVRIPNEDFALRPGMPVEIHLRPAGAR